MTKPKSETAPARAARNNGDLRIMVTSPADVAEPPHNLEAEQAVLGAIFVEPEVLGDVRQLLRSPDAFWRVSHQHIYRACCKLADAGQPLDWVTCLAEIERAEKLEDCGGRDALNSYLSDITNGLPSGFAGVSYAHLVANTALKREIARRAADLRARALDVTSTAASLLGDWERSQGDLAKLAPSHTPDLDHWLNELLNAPPPVPTGIDELDRNLAGGVYAGSTTVMAGAAGAGKTTLALQIARNLARSGVCCVWLAADEHPTRLVQRNMQSVGVSRAKARKPDADTCRQARRMLAALDIRLLNHATIEDAFTEVARLAGDRQKAVFIDSIQLAATREVADDIRTQVTNAMHMTAKLADRHRAIVVVLSEVNRAFYRNRQSAMNSEPLAAGAESRALEFGPDVLVVLANVKNGDGLVDVCLPKNRFGPRDVHFGLKLDHESATFHAAALDGDATDAARSKASEALRAKLHALVARYSDGVSTNLLRGQVSVRYTELTAALEALAHDGKIKSVKGSRGAVVWHSIAEPEAPSA